MFIIFGWLKESYNISAFINHYCYNCGCKKFWVLHTETEWVTFFDIKTVPFLTKRKIFCERCGDGVNVSWTRFHFQRGNSVQFGLWIGSLQLSHKTETQRRYLIERRKNDDGD